MERITTTRRNEVTPDERLTAWADKMGITVDDIKRHTAKTVRSQIVLQEAKNAGATDTELIKIATHQ